MYLRKKKKTAKQPKPLAPRQYPEGERNYVTTVGWVIPAAKETSMLTLLQMMHTVETRLQLKYSARRREFVLYVPPGFLVPKKLTEMMHCGNFPRQRIELRRTAV